MLIAGALSLSGVIGCKPKAPQAPATAVGQGELFQTDRPVYDEYFATVHELHAAVATGELEERDARTTLATMLQLLPTAPAEQVLRKLREQTDELPRMQLIVEPDKKDEKRKRAEIKLADRGRPDDATKNLVIVLEATANADLDLIRRMAEIPERSHRMHSVGKALADGVDKEFSDTTPERRQEVRNELQASLDVLVMVANDSRAVETRVRAFVEGLQKALEETMDNEPSDQGAKPRGGPRPAAKPVPKMPDDFNP